MKAKHFFLSLPILGFIIANPVAALELQFGDDFGVDLDKDKTRVIPNISTDGNRLNIQLEEQKKPETQIRFNDNGGIQIRRKYYQPKERLNLSVPLRDSGRSRRF